MNSEKDKLLQDARQDGLCEVEIAQYASQLCEVEISHSGEFPTDSSWDGLLGAVRGSFPTWYEILGKVGRNPGRSRVARTVRASADDLLADLQDIE